jgi:hypothetical protein
VSGFNLIRHELNKLKLLPPWGRAQGDRWDQLSNFIYRVQTLGGVQRQAQAVANAAGLPVEAFEAYAVRRWYNHHTHDQILQMFLTHPDVRPEANQKHHSIDFYLRNLPFDLKISRFPKAYPETLKYAWQHRHHLALWEYENQSKQGRYHASNRLFLIQEFLTVPTLFGLTITNPKTQEIHRPWAAVIFHVK